MTIEHDTNGLGGKIERRWFANGFGVSILTGPPAYGGMELAVLHEVEGEGWTLCYATEITEDVIGHLTPAFAERIAQLVASLDPAPECDHGRLA